MYQLNGKVFSTVNEVKYLGVWVACDLNWSPHINRVSNRANRSLGFLRRNLRQCPPALKERAYLAQVRSVLEYCSSIWDPHLRKDVNQVEKIQRRAARFVCRDYGWRSSVTDMLHKLGWRDLELRRRDTRLALLYKILNDHVAVTADELGVSRVISKTRAGQPDRFTLRAPRAKSTEFENSFTIRTVSQWNNLKLPASVVKASTPEKFCAQLTDFVKSSLPQAPPP